MKIGVPMETIEGENRVALVPDSVKKLKSLGYEILIEKSAGLRAGYNDADYQQNGATLVEKAALSDCEIILKVRHPHEINGSHEALSYKDGASIFSFQDIINQKSNLEVFRKKKQNSFAMEFIPRISLAQSMDVLSSMATVAGYKAVLLATNHLGRFLPMFMTAAGTIPPAKTLVLGVGVAGLQAIATAKRLGSVVEAFDTRPVVKEQVMSLGAKFIELDFTEDAQDDQGYAKEASEDFIKKERALIDKHLSKADICITTAQVFGKKAPLLIHDYMVDNMKPGSVIVDLAAEQGGNCELSKPGEVVVHNQVSIIGPSNIASTMADHASKMYSKNIENLLTYLTKDGNLTLNDEDEIVKRSLITRDGELVSELVKSFNT